MSLTVDLCPSVASSDLLAINAWGGSVTFGIGSAGVGPGVPPQMVSHAEAYYWSATWQAGEKESLAALENGEGITFDSDDPTDVARWLLSDDD